MMPLAVDGFNRDVSAFSDYGYMIIPALLSGDEIADLHRAFDDLAERLPVGERVYRFLNERVILQDQRFFRALTKPALLDTVRQIIGHDVQLIDYLAVTRPPHAGKARGWHTDYPGFFSPSPVGITCLIYLQDMTDEVGPFYFLPASHKWQRPPSDDERSRPLLHEAKFGGPAGTAMLTHANLWHSGSRNETAAPRRALHLFFTHHWFKRLDMFYRTPLPDYITGSDDPFIRQLFGLQLPQPNIHGRDYNEQLYS